jgi:tRNA threonylcarbamoyladenosine biosynthesis protein TsaB
MNLLAFDTSTDTMSIAVQQGVGAAARVWQHSGAGGAQASTHLIPAIQQLMDEAGLRFEQLDAIAFGRGPGSFTGLRTACSVAQGLAFGAGIQVLPVDSLLAVAEEVRFQHMAAENHLHVLAVLDARMDEVYAGHYEFASGQWLQHGGYSLVWPENLNGALALPQDFVMAGNAFAVYADRLPSPTLPPVYALPTASAMLRLAPQLLAAGQAVSADQALPTYIRDKVAKTTQERLAEKAAA